MTARDDDSGGIAVWPEGALFRRVRPRDVPNEFEHRVFTFKRARAMLVFIREVQQAVRGVENRIDDSRGIMRAGFLGAIMEAEARYRASL